MKKGKVIVVGLGPGSNDFVAPIVKRAIDSADVIIGYKYYFKFIKDHIPENTVCVDTGMKREVERAKIAFDYALNGNCVVVISSGDSGIYGMAPLILEMGCQNRYSDIDVEVLPGISAFQMASSLLGAPMGHDFCVISLSDLMTPWEKIEKRIVASADSDFITAIYNPKSKERYWQLHRAREIFLMYRDPSTPVGIVRQAGREEQQVTVTTLEKFDYNQTDMFTIIIIGNSQSYIYEKSNGTKLLITPRGYFNDREDFEDHNKNRKEEGDSFSAGREIMINSFANIAREVKREDLTPQQRWTVFHAIHTTADFEMENIIYFDKNVVDILNKKFRNGSIKRIVTDVNMVASGIRKSELERYGVEVLCYINDLDIMEDSKLHGTTRAVAAIKKALLDSVGTLFVFGNAPTALIELCNSISRGYIPEGVIAAPVGFVNVLESKYMIKTFENVPKIIVEGRKGGSNLAATIVNSIMSYDDSSDLMIPGRGL